MSALFIGLIIGDFLRFDGLRVGYICQRQSLWHKRGSVMADRAQGESKADSIDNAGKQDDHKPLSVNDVDMKRR